MSCTLDYIPTGGNGSGKRCMMQEKTRYDKRKNSIETSQDIDIELTYVGAGDQAHVRCRLEVDVEHDRWMKQRGCSPVEGKSPRPYFLIQSRTHSLHRPSVVGS